MTQKDDGYELDSRGLFVPKTHETAKDKVILSKAKDFERKAIENPGAIDDALRIAVERLPPPKIDLDADVVEKTEKLLGELPVSEPNPETTIGRQSTLFLDEMFGNVEIVQSGPAEPVGKAPVRSTGGSTSYYQIPPGSTELNDLIEHKGMSFAVGNIFKACYRLGEKDGTDAMYDVNKIIFFAERLKRHLERHGRLP